MTEIVLRQGNCLELMEEIPAASVDLVFCDLPYGMTSCSWDKALPPDALWNAYRRVLKPSGAVVLTAIQPFASKLIVSNLKWFRVEWIWDKVSRTTGFLNARHYPLRRHESVLVFSPKPPRYVPQMTTGAAYVTKRGLQKATEVYATQSRIDTVNHGTRYPHSIVPIRASSAADPPGQHPTQKPFELALYFLRTYSRPGETVLDNCMGRGTTGVAAVRCGRRFIGIEQDPSYFQVAERLIEQERKRGCIDE